MKSFKIKGKPNWLVILAGLVILVMVILQLVEGASEGDVFAALNLNFVNFALYGAMLIMLGNVANVELALDDGVKSIGGILLQFPLYAGIMGIMKESGLVADLANFFIHYSGERSFSVLTFF